MSFAAAIPLIGKVLDAIFPDKKAADEAKLQVLALASGERRAELDADTKLALAGSENVRSEATGGSWLQRNWRPMTMLIFVGLVVARFFGWSQEGISEAEYMELWAMVKLGLGGYVAGRSVEKTAEILAPVLAKKNGN